ncbi:MAG: DUF393 domain-containing protein [Motiliproteus sp.]
MKKITVFYDGSCPRCVADRRRYEALAGDKGCRDLCWLDITGQEQKLRDLGIDPLLALTELHLQDQQGQIRSELNAYILLMERVIWLKPLAWLLGTPFLRPRLSRLYHQSVERRLRREGRYPHR